MSMRRLGGCERSEPAPTRPTSRALQLPRNLWKVSRVSGARPTMSGVRPRYSKFLSLSRAEIYSRLATPQSSEVRFVPHLWMSLQLTFDQNCEKGNRDLFPPGDWSVGGHNRARRPRASSVTRAFTPPGVAPHVERTCSHRGSRAKRRVRHPSAVYGAPALARQTWVTASTRRMRSSRRLGRGRTGRCTRPGTGRRVVWWR